MTVGTESLILAVGVAERELLERSRSRFFPTEYSYQILSERLKPRALQMLQRIDPIVAGVCHQVMSERGIQNLRVVRDSDAVITHRLPDFNYILRFQEGQENTSWSEDLGFKSVILNYYFSINAFSVDIPLVVQNGTGPELQLQEALRLARNSGSGKLTDAKVYFVIYHSTNVTDNLKSLLNLALVRPIRVSPKF